MAPVPGVGYTFAHERRLPPCPNPPRPVVALYGLTLCLAGLSFSLMGWYVFFHSDLLLETLPLVEMRREWRRSWLGTAWYGLAAGLAFFSVPAALGRLALIPFGFVVPRLRREA